MQNTEDKIHFNFTYYALKLLGSQLYDNPWTAISELVANGLDAQATNVKLYINMTDKERSTIEIIDNGTGMSYDDLSNKYVFMGKNKREDEAIDEEIRKSYMGRKGIGKLAALFLSQKYYIITKTNEEPETAWFLDSKNVNESDIPKLERCSLNNIKIETKDNWSKIDSGTIIKLTNVNLTGIGIHTIEGLKARLADFFLVDSLNSSIEICVLTDSTSNIEFQPIKKSIAFKNMCAFFENSDKCFSSRLANNIVFANAKYRVVAQKKRTVQHLNLNDFPMFRGERELTLKDGKTKTVVQYELSGWIGVHTSIQQKYACFNDELFMKNKAYNPSQLRLYIRNKLAVENFMDLMGRTQAMDNYVEGEINFDLLDDDRFNDITTTNRQSLLAGDERVKLLKEILNPIIQKLISERIKLGNDVKREIEAIEEAERLKKKKEKEAAEKKAEAERKAKEAAEKKAEAERKAKEAAEKKAEDERKAKEAAEKEAENEKKRSRFIIDTMDETQINFAKRLHMARTNITIMNNIIKSAIKMKNKEKFTVDNAWVTIKSFSSALSRLNTVLKYSAAVKFDTKQEFIEGDLFRYISEYCKNERLLGLGRPLAIEIKNELGEEYIMRFSHQDISIILQNICSNSSKQEYHAKNLCINMRVDNETAVITFEDDGLGVNPDVKDVNELFEFGKSYSPTGTGVGLYHINEIVKNKLKGQASIMESVTGFKLEIRINR